MTDAEIVKALECCAKDDCESCPLCDYDGCKSLLFDGDIVIDLINCQKLQIKKLENIERFATKAIVKQDAEIERLKAEIVIRDKIIDERGKEVIRHDNAIRSLHKQLDNLKSEAIKEFADRLTEKVEKARQKYQRLCKEQGEKEDEAMNIHFKGIVKLIDNLVKEMTE